MRTSSPTPTLAVVALGAGPPAAGTSGTIAYQQTDDEGLFQRRSVPAADGAATQLATGSMAPNPDACPRTAALNNRSGAPTARGSSRLGPGAVRSHVVDGAPTRPARARSGLP